MVLQSQRRQCVHLVNAAETAPRLPEAAQPGALRPEALRPGAVTQHSKMVGPKVEQLRMVRDLKMWRPRGADPKMVRRRMVADHLPPLGPNQGSHPVDLLLVTASARVHNSAEPQADSNSGHRVTNGDLPAPPAQRQTGVQPEAQTTLINALKRYAIQDNQYMCFIFMIYLILTYSWS